MRHGRADRMAVTVGLSIAPWFLVITAALVSQAAAAQTTRPFWTEKSSFIEGGDLFVVGVASHVRSVEEGRQKAFEHGKVELMNFAQVTDLEAQGLVVETQMTYEESNSDGTVTVFRLLRVPMTKLVAIQDRLRTRNLSQEKALEQSRLELKAMQESLARKQQELEVRTRSVQESLVQIAQLQSGLSEKAQRIEHRQREVESLLQQLAQTIGGEGSQSKGSLTERLKQAEARLDEKGRELDGIYRRVLERIHDQEQKACKYVTPGMRPSDVRQLIGEPDGNFVGVRWSYGRVIVHFNAQKVVESISGCRNR